MLLVIHDKALISEKRVKNFAILFKVSDILVVMKNRRYHGTFFRLVLSLTMTSNTKCWSVGHTIFCLLR